MGEKAPIVDFLLEILDENTPYYFMVQVKSTTQGYQKNGDLKASVDENKMKKLLERHMPTYVAGVDVNKEKVYLCPAFDPNTKYSSIPTTHCLSLSAKKNSQKLLNQLKDDVINFWNTVKVLDSKTKFKSSL